MGDIAAFRDLIASVTTQYQQKVNAAVEKACVQAIAEGKGVRVICYPGTFGADVEVTDAVPSGTIEWHNALDEPDGS